MEGMIPGSGSMGSTILPGKKIDLTQENAGGQAVLRYLS